MTSNNRRFSGFGRETFQYLADLKANNYRGWFQANRARYESAWKAPALDLIAALAAPMAALDPPLKAEARLNGSLRRINRDVRFSRDKAPYHTMMHLIFWSGSHPNRSPGIHFVLDHDGIGYGAGVYGLEPAQLISIRARIVDAGDRAQLLRAVTGAHKVGCDFDPPELKRLPKGYEADGDWEHLLRRKLFVMRTQRNQPAPDWMLSDRCVDRIMGITQALMPLLRWLGA